MNAARDESGAGRPAAGGQRTGEVSKRPVYLLLDMSGSTVREGFAAACAQALPALVDEAARHPGVLVSVLAYATRAEVLVRLSEPGSVRLIPALAPSGLSSLAAGLRLLAQTVQEDARHLVADEIRCLTPLALVVADGLPTDPDADLLTSREALDAASGGPPPLLHAAMPDGVGRLAVAGLRMTFHPLPPGPPDEVSGSLLTLFSSVLAAVA